MNKRCFLSLVLITGSIYFSIFTENKTKTFVLNNKSHVRSGLSENQSHYYEFEYVEKAEDGTLSNKRKVESMGRIKAREEVCSRILYTLLCEVLEGKSFSSSNMVKNLASSYEALKCLEFEDKKGNKDDVVVKRYEDKEIQKLNETEEA